MRGVVYANEGVWSMRGVVSGQWEGLIITIIKHFWLIKVFINQGGVSAEATPPNLNIYTLINGSLISINTPPMDPPTQPFN